MANIKITVDGPLMDGHKITFKAPCNCDVVEKLDVRYVENSTQKSKLFTMKDSHGNDLTGLGNLFYKDAYVDVVLDPNSGSAYLQNAGTNAYLEEKLKTAGTPVDNLLSDRADLPLSARQGKILNDSLEWKYLGEYAQEVEVDITTISFNELLVVVGNPTSYDGVCGIINIPYIALNSDYRRFRNGFFAQSTSGGLHQVRARKTSINYDLQYSNGATKTDGKMRVYYR